MLYMVVWVGCKLTLLLRVALLSVWKDIDVCGCVGRQMKEMTELTKWIFLGENCKKQSVQQMERKDKID